MAARTDEEAARERFAAMGEIAAEIAHELRNVLQVITASAYLARQAPPDSAPHIAKIEKNARVAHGIVDDLMSLARGEPAHAEPVLLYELLVAARQDLDPGAATFEDEVTPNDLRVRAHTGLCTRLFHVFFENAIAVSSPRPPRIVTRARRDGELVVIDVQDDGPGVPPDIAARIFEPLFTAREGGSGLGLALAKRIVAAHGGDLELVPQTDAAGATFRIRFPTKPPPRPSYVDR